MERPKRNTSFFYKFIPINFQEIQKRSQKRGISAEERQKSMIYNIKLIDIYNI